MAHQIYANDGIVLAGEKAWHGLGIVLPEAVTPEESLRIGKLDWTAVESASLTATFVAADGSADRVVVDTHKTLRRSDDLSVLATVGADYSVLQNRQLAIIASSLGKEGEAKVESAGSLLGGRKVFFCLKGDTLDIGRKGDIVHQFILLANSHDGTMSTTVLPTSVRVVCQNTLTMALGGVSTVGAYRWRHTSGLAMRTEDIKIALACYAKNARIDASAMEALAAKSLTYQEIQTLWTDVLVALDGPIVLNTKNEKQYARNARAVDALASMARVFDGEQKQFGPTAWVAANSMTHYLQRRGTLKGDARVNSDLFGSYGAAKRVAMQKALALI